MLRTRHDGVMETGDSAPRLRAVMAMITAACACFVLWPVAQAHAAPLTFSVDSPAGVTEGNPGTAGSIVFTVKLSEAAGNTVTVDVHTSSVTATSSLDFFAVPSTTLTFAPGETEKTVTVQLVGDETDEPDESFTLQLTNATGGATIPPPAFGTGTIIDDDPPPTVSIADASVTEQSNATSLMAFKISLSRASAKTVTVKWATADGTATAPADYTQTNNQITFSPGTVSQNITVQIVGDTVDETDETFTVTLSDPTNATIAAGTATGTIRDDDGPSITITGATVTEGASGTSTVARLTVALGAVSPQDVSVAYATANGSATAPEDYTAIPAGQRLTIPAGQLVGTIDVLVHGDDVDEADENLSVNLTSPQGGNITAATGTVTITDDDPTPSVVAFDTTLLEGTGIANAATVTVGLTTASNRALTATYETRDGTAQAGVDYARQSGSLVFNPGEKTKVVTIPIGADSAIEEDESFSLVVTDTAETGRTAVATIRILDDDLTPAATPNLSISDGTPVREGDSGTTDAEFTVRLDAPLTRHVTVRYATEPGSATSPEDFEATDGVLTFVPGQTVQTVEVPVKGDKRIESNHDFTVKLSEPYNARLAKATGLGIIVDDDAGLDRLAVPGKAIRATSLLCRRSSSKSCAGLLVRWGAVVNGTMRVDVDAYLPAKKTKSTTKTKSKAKSSASKRRLRLMRRTYKVKRGSASRRVRRSGSSAARLVRRLRAAKVRSVRITATFTNKQGAQESKRFTVKLR